MNQRQKKEEKRLEELAQQLTLPDILNNPRLYTELSREYKKLQQLVECYKEKDKLTKELEELKELLKGDDSELKEMAEDEIPELEKRLSELDTKIEVLSNPEYEEFQKNCIVEIRAGTGGDEATLFAADLFRMYAKFIEQKGLKYEVLSSHPSDIGGFKEIIFLVQGENAYRYLRFEKGVHRVQRIPVTETGGRIHTSTATVAVLLEVEDTQFQIDPNDLKLETFRASGHGGQHVNKVSSAVRITHLPTNITVTCQDERSQFKNREKAMKILRARLAQMEKEKKERALHQERQQQLGTGDRSEKIRTYNFPQNRVTDHRSGLTLYNLDRVLNGELASIIDNLEEYEKSHR
ncbi:peptide chain release factor 1 [candidate division WOR-3 bacterium 4484_100]|uniref:Peptide chain release factor 1 n=1 Tax=candidate division WOR-3 bacterium 4484_100 TaxID=1936077 RepID=A0A1V4QF22_UNCW3|nr:MAG: peptide chain release factor 1 [candidate division WOR-3 bacterium 4484_100]